MRQWINDFLNRPKEPVKPEPPPKSAEPTFDLARLNPRRRPPPPLLPPPPPGRPSRRFAWPWAVEQRRRPVRAPAPENDGELTEERTQALIMDSRADWRDTMLSPFWGFYHGGNPFRSKNALNRHYQRHMQVAGVVARVRGLGKRLLFIGGVAALAGLAGWYLSQHTFPWVVWSVMGLAVFLLWGFSGVPGKYHAAFALVYTLERADYTDLSQVTNYVQCYLPRLALYDKKDIWRGNDLQDSWTDRGAVAVLQTGVDEIVPNADYGDWAAEIWCGYRPGKLVEDFRMQGEFYELQADTYMMTGVTAVMRRVFCRALWNSGKDFRELEKGDPAWYDGRIGLIVGGIAAGVGLVALALA